MFTSQMTGFILSSWRGIAPKAPVLAVALLGRMERRVPIPLNVKPIQPGSSSFFLSNPENLGNLWINKSVH
jgi:hypothetical protein